MRGMHIHTFGWMHPHSPDWRSLGSHLGRLAHDSRLWIVLALAILFGLMVLLSAVLVGSDSSAPMTPIYPMTPYLP